MKVGKPKSKRVPVRLRHKIEKAGAAKQRKQRKEAKKNPQWRSRLKKDPGIPNLFPYKAQVLAEIEETKKRKAEEQVRKRELAKAQREGRAVTDMPTSTPAAVTQENEDEDLLQDEDDVEGVEVDEDMGDDSSNPMAALLASAQARAQAHESEEEDDEDDGDNDEWGGIEVESTKPTPGQPTRKMLPKQALADPIKAVSALIERMQKTQDGIQRMLDHYSIPPLVTAGSELNSRFLCEVARKRGRLGRGGIPNMHSAALTVLGDLNEERLRLPADADVSKTSAPARAVNKGEVTVVNELAPAFRIEGLFGDDGRLKGPQPMAVDP